jgi:formate/nitrite transporter FocA (FNT family)
MATKTPQEIAEAAVDTGATKAKLGWDKALVGGFLAGAYIAFGGLVAIAVSSGLNPEIWGTLPTRSPSRRAPATAARPCAAR